MEQQKSRTEAARCAKILLGCYRIADAADPDIYVAAVTEVLAAYPLEVMLRVIDPNNGLPAKCKWLPAIAELKDECERIVAPARKQAAREKQISEQLRERAQRERELAQNSSQKNQPQGKTYDAKQFAEAVKEHGRPVGPFESGRQYPYRG